MLLGLLVTARGRQSLLKAGALYTALDLLAQHRRGAAAFSKTEAGPRPPRIVVDDNAFGVSYAFGVSLGEHVHLKHRITRRTHQKQ